MGWRRVWRDLRLRRPAFDLVADPDAPLQYRGRPFALERLPVDDRRRGEIRRWAEQGSADDGSRLAQALADALRAPVVCLGHVHRPAVLGT